MRRSVLAVWFLATALSLVLAASFLLTRQPPPRMEAQELALARKATSTPVPTLDPADLAPALPFNESSPELLAKMQRHLYRHSPHNGPALLEYFHALRRVQGANGTSTLPIVTPHPYNYVTQCGGERACGGAGVFLLALVPSAVTHAARRALIRATWARREHYALNVSVVFLLGRPERDPGGVLQSAVLQV